MTFYDILSDIINIRTKWIKFMSIQLQCITHEIYEPSVSIEISWLIEQLGQKGTLKADFTFSCSLWVNWPKYLAGASRLANPGSTTVI